MGTNKKTDVVLIKLMDCVTGTTTSSEGMVLLIKMDKAIAAGKLIKLSLKDATPLSSSFLNSSFGELFDKYGYSRLKKSITLVNYLPSQAETISKYLQSLNKLVR